MDETGIHNIKVRFKHTYCSQCDKDFGPGWDGYSFCGDHAKLTPQPLTARQLINGEKPVEASHNYCAGRPVMDHEVSEFLANLSQRLEPVGMGLVRKALEHYESKKIK